MKGPHEFGRLVNAFGHHGTVVQDPNYLLGLDGVEGSTYGELSIRGYGYQETIEWLVMASLGIPMGEVCHWCSEHNPVLVLTNCETAKVYRYSYNTGKCVD